ncbi:hypothetical protein P4C99_20555, partial [Pontiellaceae bacterium B1224]|nr:hypothetical protein [Pontiellaceae bacterium B1224]
VALHTFCSCAVNYLSKVLGLLNRGLPYSLFRSYFRELWVGPCGFNAWKDYNYAERSRYQGKLY